MVVLYTWELVQLFQLVQKSCYYSIQPCFFQLELVKEEKKRMKLRL